MIDATEQYHCSIKQNKLYAIQAWMQEKYCINTLFIQSENINTGEKHLII
jgi:hypothetical protein